MRLLFLFLRTATPAWPPIISFKLLLDSAHHWTLLAPWLIVLSGEAAPVTEMQYPQASFLLETSFNDYLLGLT